MMEIGVNNIDLCHSKNDMRGLQMCDNSDFVKEERMRLPVDLWIDSRIVNH